MALRLPVPAGPLRGAWWLPASGGKLMRVLGGTYEPQQTRLFAEHVRPGATLLDVGAHVGYYTLLGARLAGPTGRVFAWEPNPRNAEFLREHLRINRMHQVEVMEQAVSDREGTACFAFGTGSGTGHLDGTGELTVPVTTLDGWLRGRQVAPGAIKIDVEGAEAALLRGARELLDRWRPVLFLSTHGPAAHADSLALVREHGYRVEPIQRARVEDDSELLCVHPSRPRVRFGA